MLFSQKSDIIFGYSDERTPKEAGLIIGNQIIIMFIILIIGAFCYLKGIITKDGTK